MYCSPPITDPYRTKKVAEVACSDNPQCEMFFEFSDSDGVKFLLCDGDSVKKYASNYILYSKSK